MEFEGQDVCWGRAPLNERRWKQDGQGKKSNCRAVPAKPWPNPEGSSIMFIDYQDSKEHTGGAVY